MARANAVRKQKSPCISRTKLLAFLSFLFLASPCDAQVGLNGRGASDGSLGGDLYFGGYPDEFIDGIKSEDFAEAARKDWDAMSKALNKSSKEDFDKSAAEIKNLNDAAESRWELRLHELKEYEEQHADAIEHLEKGKIEDDDVDVLKRYKELKAKKQQALDDLNNIAKLKKLADHSWKEWTEFWERKTAWDKEHPGKDMLAKRGKNWPFDDDKKTGERSEKPAQAETHKTKSVKKRSVTKKEEAAADADGTEIAAGIAAVLLGTQMGRHERSRREHGDSHATMKKTTTRTTTRSGTTKSGTSRNGSSGGATMNTTVGAPTITFGGGGMRF